MKKKQIINETLKRIKRTISIYNQASKSVHSTVVQKELTEIRNRRKHYLKELTNAFNNRGKPAQEVGGLWAFTSKIWLKLNDFFIQRNVPNILITCVKSDQELLKYYGKSTEYKLSDEVSRLINHQKSEIQKLNDEFKERINSYPWV